ncbi:Signal transduction protein containing GAF and PtsI domains [Candidatus Bealeia paramacronuclearis]|uniref:Phosphoenolpyruvate-protein phosphotransferase n=1 Tax=Candidatus Bealeia paramacronuclearis TaxID=1921001 RepID=A0ABZ2C4N2_9PROT|nr:Signal transduction protein containing GAF and PtsI domains [Candidatus Bealeia paramacronuclearis]
MLSKLNELEKTFTVQDDTYHESLTIEGISFSGGVGVGEIVLHQPRSWSHFRSSNSTSYERDRLRLAIREMMESIDDMVKDHVTSAHRDPQEILETYKTFAADRGWIKKIQAQIQTGLTAEAAVDAVRRESRDKYAQIGNKYLKGHLADLEDLANRLIAHLTGEDFPQKDLPSDMILIAHQMGPAELLDYDQRNLRGVILEEGIHTSHMAIVARAMGIPVVGRIHNLLLNLKLGQKIIVDGEEGTITLNPDPIQIEEAQKKSLTFSKWKTELKALANLPTETKDGMLIHLQLNAGLMIDLQYIHDSKVEGIGLYRTEIPFMMHSKFPDVEVQAQLYADVLDHAKGKPVVFRTLDLGGDKIVPYMWRVTDENPAMGWRAIRVSLDRPALLKQQLRALIQAASDRDLNVMFPLITTAEEYLRAKKFLNEEMERAKSKSEIMPKNVRVGLMVETPSIVWELDQIASEVDFISLGTNDLFQFFFACDRTNPNLAHRYDVLSLGYLRFLRLILNQAEVYKIPLSVCGEMVRNPLEILALMGIGYRSFSMNVSSIPAIKRLVRNTNLSDFKAYMENALGTSKGSLREGLKKFATENGLLPPHLL